jgi:antirestriction protein ArdC
MNTPTTSTQRSDLYTRVTERVVADLERGARPWLKPWTSGRTRITRPRRHNGMPYRGVNVLLLWGEAIDRGYSAHLWMTYRQALELGAHVRQGEHGTTVVYADRIVRKDTDDAGHEVERAIPFLKAYTVFNVAQIENLPAHYVTQPEPQADPVERIASAEAFIAATGATLRHGGDRAYYSPKLDIIQLPVPEAFRDAESYAATTAHELTHWTAHPTRLNRDFGGRRFGDTGYAREELVAELGSAFLCADLGITPEPREDHAAYLAHWIAVLKDDKRAIFAAAAHAQKAVDYLDGLQPTAMPVPGERRMAEGAGEANGSAIMATRREAAAK